jgi:hypothetical protein
VTPTTAGWTIQAPALDGAELRVDLSAAPPSLYAERDPERMAQHRTVISQVASRSALPDAACYGEQ